MISARFDQLQRQKTELVEEVYPLLNEKCGNTLTLRKVMHCFRSTVLWRCCDSTSFVEDFVKTGFIYSLLENPGETRKLKTQLSLITEVMNKALARAIDENPGLFPKHANSENDMSCIDIKQGRGTIFWEMDRLGWFVREEPLQYHYVQSPYEEPKPWTSKLPFAIQKNESESGRFLFRFHNVTYQTLFYVRYLLSNYSHYDLVRLRTVDDLLSNQELISTFLYLAFGRKRNYSQHNFHGDERKIGFTIITNMLKVFESEFPECFASAAKYANDLEQFHLSLNLKNPRLFYYKQRLNGACPVFPEGQKKKLFDFCFLILTLANETEDVYFANRWMLDAFMCMCCHYAANDPEASVNVANLRDIWIIAHQAPKEMLYSNTHQVAVLKLLYLMSNLDNLIYFYFDRFTEILGESDTESKELVIGILRHAILMWMTNDTLSPREVAQFFDDVDSEEFRQDLRARFEEIPDELQNSYYNGCLRDRFIKI